MIGIGKLKNNLSFDMTYYLTVYNLGYDHKSAPMQKLAHMKGISSIDS